MAVNLKKRNQRKSWLRLCK